MQATRIVAVPRRIARTSAAYANGRAYRLPLSLPAYHSRLVGSRLYVPPDRHGPPWPPRNQKTPWGLFQAHGASSMGRPRSRVINANQLTMRRNVSAKSVVELKNSSNGKSVGSTRKAAFH